MHLSELRSGESRVLQVPARGWDWRGLSAVGDHHVGVCQQADTWLVHSGRVLDARVWDFGELDRDDGGVRDLPRSVPSQAQGEDSE